MYLLPRKLSHQENGMIFAHPFCLPMTLLFSWISAALSQNLLVKAIFLWFYSYKIRNRKVNFAIFVVSVKTVTRRQGFHSPKQMYWWQLKFILTFTQETGAKEIENNLTHKHMRFSNVIGIGSLNRLSGPTWLRSIMHGSPEYSAAGSRLWWELQVCSFSYADVMRWQYTPIKMLQTRPAWDVLDSRTQLVTWFPAGAIRSFDFSGKLSAIQTHDDQ